jgi:uncharacterized protein (DUF1015 family)
MAEIFPFRAYRYDPGQVALENALTQPYDKITPAMQERYYGASPYNLIPIEKGKSFPDDGVENNVYTRAAGQLDKLIREGILRRDDAAAIYVYFQEFTVPGSAVRRTRHGFVALGRVEDYSSSVVFRHEKTLTGPKADRLELLRHTRTQTGQLFMLYEDRGGEMERLLAQASRRPADATVRDEYDVVHHLWVVTDASLLQRLAAGMASKKLVIADGHHRYETALVYRDECRERTDSADLDAAYEKAMMTFVSVRDHGLLILPTHRVVAQLSNFDFSEFREKVRKYFDWYAYPFADQSERDSSFAEFRRDLERRRERHALGVYGGDGAFYLFLLRPGAAVDDWLPDLTPAQRELDVVLLHRLLLEKGLGITAEAVTQEKNITYEREVGTAIAAADQGVAQLACLLNPVRVEQVYELALAGEVLPQKSTDFYPKLLSGLAIYRME